MLNFDKNYCTGCTACTVVCPVGAVKMTTSENGFYISSVDDVKCINCRKCEQICPIVHPPGKLRDFNQVNCKALYTKNLEDRKESTSGGVFWGLARYVIEAGGVVCGCVWDTNFKAVHVCTDDLAIAEKMRGSKYVQSDLGNCISQIRELITNKIVLFCGLPCQVEAISRCIGKNKNLILCALICGGCPSPEVWRQYKEALEKKIGSKIVAVSHRSKKKKWLVSNMQFEFENKKVINELLMDNLYGQNYVKGLIINEACFECKFKLESLTADLIIGDHWEINRENLKRTKNMGASTVIIMSKKGERVIETILPWYDIAKTSVNKAILVNPPLMYKHARNSKRNNFFSELHKEDVIENLSNNLPERSYPVFRKVLYRSGLYVPVYTCIWKIRKMKGE